MMDQEKSSNGLRSIGNVLAYFGLISCIVLGISQVSFFCKSGSTILSMNIPLFKVCLSAGVNGVELHENMAQMCVQCYSM